MSQVSDPPIFESYKYYICLISGQEIESRIEAKDYQSAQAGIEHRHNISLETDSYYFDIKVVEPDDPSDIVIAPVVTELRPTKKQSVLGFDKWKTPHNVRSFVSNGV